MARQAVTDPSPPSREPLALIEHDGRLAHVDRALGEIDLDRLATEVQEAGGHAIWWGILAARGAGAAARAKRALKVTRAERGKHHRSQLARDPGAKITDKIIEEMVETDPAVDIAEQSVINADEQAAILRSVAMSVDEKQRTLRALTSALARELDATHDGDPLRTTMRREMRRGGRE